MNGDIACAERLLQPARRVLKEGPQLRLEPYEQRVASWNEIRLNQDRFLREECGMFLEEIDLHMRAQYDAALVALASSFHGNGEDFPQLARFSPEEILLWERIGKYSAMEIRTQDDLRNRILKRDPGQLALFREYYYEMDGYVESALDDPAIRLTLRYFLRRKWELYRRKMDAAIADAITRFDWFPGLVREWENGRGGA